MLKPDYPNVGTTRWLVEIRLERGEVSLDDGSQWRIDPAWDALLACWNETSRLVIEPLTIFERPRYLLNVDGTKVPASLLGFDRLGEPETRPGDVPAPPDLHAD